MHAACEMTPHQIHISRHSKGVEQLKMAPNPSLVVLANSKQMLTCTLIVQLAC